MFDMFTSRNVKKIFKYPLSRPTKYSECTHDVRPNTLKFVGHFSGVSQTFWEGYVRPESMSFDTLGVYCMAIYRCQTASQVALFVEFLILWISLPTKIGTPRIKVISQYLKRQQKSYKFFLFNIYIFLHKPCI